MRGFPVVWLAEFDNVIEASHFLNVVKTAWNPFFSTPLKIPIII
jgi:hypothetical protein